MFELTIETMPITSYEILGRLAAKVAPQTLDVSTLAERYGLSPEVLEKLKTCYEFGVIPVALLTPDIVDAWRAISIALALESTELKGPDIVIRDLTPADLKDLGYASPASGIYTWELTFTSVGTEEKTISTGDNEAIVVYGIIDYSPVITIQEFEVAGGAGGTYLIADVSILHAFEKKVGLLTQPIIVPPNDQATFTFKVVRTDAKIALRLWGVKIEKVAKKVRPLETLYKKVRRAIKGMLGVMS